AEELAAQARFEAGFYPGPFTLDHGEDHGVAIAAVRAYALVAKRPLVAGAQLLDRGLRMQIVDVGLQRHPDRVPVIEGMAHQQVLRFRIDDAAPGNRRVPGPADLDGPIVILDIQVAGAPDHAIVLEADDHEGILAALRLRVHRLREPTIHKLRRQRA